MDQATKEAYYNEFCRGKAVKREDSSNNFQDKWKFPSEVRKKYGDYVKYEMAPLDETFSSGKQKYMCSFMKNDGFLIALHVGMQLTSKKSGEKYFVVEVEPMETPNIDEDLGDDE